MGAALKLLIGGPALLYAVGFARGLAAAAGLHPVHRYAPILKWLTLSLFAYVATVLVVDVPWARGAARASCCRRSPGTPHTPSAWWRCSAPPSAPICFFWQAAQEVEEIETSTGASRCARHPARHAAQLRRIGIDT